MERIATQVPVADRVLTVGELAEKERFLAELREQNRNDYINALSTAKKRGREEGEKAGREAGEKAGREEGREEGKKEGREESQQEIARSMLADGMNPDLIAKFTKLPVGEIEALRKPN